MPASSRCCQAAASTASSLSSNTSIWYDSSVQASRWAECAARAPQLVLYGLSLSEGTMLMMRVMAPGFQRGEGGGGASEAGVMKGPGGPAASGCAVEDTKRGVSRPDTAFSS